MRKKKSRGRFRGKTGQTMEDMVMSALANSQYREEVDNYFAAPSAKQQQQEAEPWLFRYEEEHENCGTPDCCNSCDDDEGLNWDSLVPLPKKVGK